MPIVSWQITSFIAWDLQYVLLTCDNLFTKIAESEIERNPGGAGGKRNERVRLLSAVEGEGKERKGGKKRKGGINFIKKINRLRFASEFATILSTIGLTSALLAQGRGYRSCDVYRDRY